MKLLIISSVPNISVSLITEAVLKHKIFGVTEIAGLKSDPGILHIKTYTNLCGYTFSECVGWQAFRQAKAVLFFWKVPDTRIQKYIVIANKTGIRSYIEFLEEEISETPSIDEEEIVKPEKSFMEIQEEKFNEASRKLGQQTSESGPPRFA